MRPTAIVYTSATGFTARYAALLSRQTGLPAYDLREPEGPPSGSRILFLGWLRAGCIQGLRRARKRYQVAAVCFVGMMEGDPADVAKVVSSNRLEHTPHFYLRGGYAPERLRGLARVMMAPMVFFLTRKPPQTEADRAVQEAFAHGADWTDPARLEPVLAWLADACPPAGGPMDTGR